MTKFNVSKHKSSDTHSWGDADCDWDAIWAAVDYIAKFNRDYGRTPCSAKEKYGIIRVVPYFSHNPLLFRWQKFIYRLSYKKALKKWPHLWLELLVEAEYGEFLNDICKRWDELDYWS